MRRTTVKVSEELDARLRQEAERRRTTVSEITRNALESYLGVETPRRLGFARAGASGRQDISERIEEILATEVG